MKQIRGLAVLVYIIIAIVIVVGLCGCATSGGGKQENSAVQGPIVTPLAQHYDKIIVYELETTPELKKDYEQDLKDCQSTLISSLLKRNKYKRVDAANSNETYENPALLVKIKVSDMRIADFGARFWGGALAGNSYMYMRMKLMDATTGELVREEDFNSVNNSFAAAWNFGASDRSLPTDMAEIIADYLDKAVQP
ncbi:hypothetical protein [uncultured Desulfobacter sp.]|uniref:hypothetical protein n=1 Tax=uncultured Desulfobacter sp. TaxID=240139 RepID=UPI0029F4AD35|nr:hypothetical protein [uncultured Desulfobacter sp.]